MWAEFDLGVPKKWKKLKFLKIAFEISALFGPKHIISAQSFQILNKHQKCYLTTIYTIGMSAVVSDIIIVEKGRLGYPTLPLGEIVASLL